MGTAFALLLSLTVLTSVVGWATRLVEGRRAEADQSFPETGTGVARAKALAAVAAVAAAMNDEARGTGDFGGRPR